MKSPGVVVLSGVVSELNELVEASDLDDVGRADDMSTDLGRDLLRDRVEDSGLSALVGELSALFDSVNTRLLGRERDRARFPSSPCSLLGLCSSLFVGLLALGLISFNTVEVVEDSLPLLSPFIRAVLSSGLRLRMVSLIFWGMFRASSTLSNALSSCCGLKDCSKPEVPGAGSRDLMLKAEIASSTLELRLVFCCSCLGVCVSNVDRMSCTLKELGRLAL